MSERISWVVATHDPAVLAANLQPALTAAAAAGDQVIVVRDASSIAAAYNEGDRQAQHPIRCFVHHDVEVLNLDGLRAELYRGCVGPVGMVGVVGSVEIGWPWWDEQRVGSVVDARLGRLDFSRGGQPAAILDGLLLATAQPLTWDEDYTGWHGYDHDACMQMLHRGRPNWVIRDGADLVRHNTIGPTATSRIGGWEDAAARWHAKWVTAGATP